MPRIVRDTVQPLDIWDCLFYGGFGPYYGRNDGPLGPSTRLFGNSNIGNLSLTNLQVAGQLPGDQTALVTNWYARTNIPDGEALKAMGEMMMCHLHVSQHVVRSAPLSTLLRRESGPVTPKPDRDGIERAAMVEATAMHLYNTHRREVRMLAPTTADAMADAERKTPADWIDERWPWENEKDKEERARWIAVAAQAVAILKPDPAIVIPVRQNFSVSVEVYGHAIEQFNGYIRRLDEPNWDQQGKRVSYLQRPPGHPSDRPGIWIHLEGWTVRD